MDFDFKKFAGEATTYFNRAVQYTNEQLGTSVEKTEYDAKLKELLRVSGDTNEWTDKIVRQTEELLVPNPAWRAEAFVNDVFDRKVPERMTMTEQLGCHFEDAGVDLGMDSAYGGLMKICGLGERKLGAAERRFKKEANQKFVAPLKNYLALEMGKINRERKLLDVKRLDLDVSKNKVRKATKPVDIQQAEESLRVSQTEFDRQAELTRLLMEEVPNHHRMHFSYLKEFISLQKQYYAECSEIMNQLENEINSFQQNHQN